LSRELGIPIDVFGVDLTGPKLRNIREVALPKAE
jgi:hypothetical protein